MLEGTLTKRLQQTAVRPRYILLQRRNSSYARILIVVSSQQPTIDDYLPSYSKMSRVLLASAWAALTGRPPPPNNGPTVLPTSQSDFDRNVNSRRQKRSTVAHRHAIGSPSYPQRSTSKRALYGNYGCTVFGWPESGGLILRQDCDLVDLKYLGIDPFNIPTSRYADQGTEDDFCAALKKIGGKWWRSEQRWLNVCLANWTPDTEPSEEEMRAVYIGWPEEGGVLVLEKEESFIPDEVGMLRMVSSMEERCRLLRDRLGAVYYTDPRAYSGFSSLYRGSNNTMETGPVKTT